MKTLIVSLISACLLFGAAEPPQFSERNPRYRLQPSDVLELQYRYTPEFNQTATIQPDGFITIAVAGGVSVAGLTLDEARAAILAKVGARLRDPELVLLLKDFEKPYFVIAGQVARPGKFEMHGPVTAVQAVAMAGGFTDKSSHSQVILYRRIGPDVAEARLLDMKAIMKSSGLDEDPALRPGDLLVVPQNRLSKIERLIRWTNLGFYTNPF